MSFADRFFANEELGEAILAQELTNLMRCQVAWQDGWTFSGLVVKKCEHPRQHLCAVEKVSITTGPRGNPPPHIGVAGSQGVEPRSMVPETIVLSIELRAPLRWTEFSQSTYQVKRQY